MTVYTAKHQLTFAEHLCKGCDLCVHVCPKKILRLSEERVNAKGYKPAVCVDIEACVGCAACAKICPDSVIGVMTLE